MAGRTSRPFHFGAPYRFSAVHVPAQLPEPSMRAMPLPAPSLPLPSAPWLPLLTETFHRPLRETAPDMLVDAFMFRPGQNGCHSGLPLP